MLFRTLRAFLPLLLVAAAKPRHFGYRVVHQYPHDPSAFVQGLEYRGGFLYEGTGLLGKSTLSRERLQTGTHLHTIQLPAEYFGEGITVIHHQILQLTWQSHIGFVYDQSSFRRIRTFTYAGEGWGLANDGKAIYMSDGTPQIRCLDPQTFAERRSFTVHDGDQAISMLNELEWVRGELFANVWHSNQIARISVTDGTVTGWIDLSGLAPSQNESDEAVLNGIAYDARNNRLFVTGKLWPRIYEIRLIARP